MKVALTGAAPIPPDVVRFFRTLGVPLVAIGGITLENAPAVISAGADCLAVISDLFGAPDIAGRAARYQSLFEKSPA